MIFDEICKNIQFVVDDINGEKEFIEDNFALGKITNKVMFPELMKMYEKDSENATILFYETDDGEMCAEINFYENDENMGDMYLRGDSFTQFMSKYCSAI